MHGPWSELPMDVMALIMAKLELPDHLRVSAVCVQWHQAYTLNLSLPSPSSPWFMLAGGTCRTARFLTQTNNRLFEIPIPDPPIGRRTRRTTRFLTQTNNRMSEIPIPDPPIRRRLIIGSSSGWLVTVSGTSSLDLHLLNPITGAQLLLPPITTLPFITTHSPKPNTTKYSFIHGRPLIPETFRRLFFIKAVISKDFTVTLLHNATQTGVQTALCYAHPHQTANWTPLNFPEGRYLDVIHHNGFLQALTDDGKLVSCTDCLSPIKVITTKHLISRTYPYFKYLVPSLTGDLLMVARCLCIPCIDFMVFTLDESDRWRQISDIGDQCLFIGPNETMAFSTLKHPELQRNSIYFTDALAANFMIHAMDRPGQSDFKVFDIGVGSVKASSCSSWRPGPPPIWFTPSLS